LPLTHLGKGADETLMSRRRLHQLRATFLIGVKEADWKLCVSKIGIPMLKKYILYVVIHRISSY
jgi:hypothetical protein